MNDTIRVVIADDAEDMSDMISVTLGSDSRFQIVGSARDGLEAIALVEVEKPDAIVLDLSMPGLDGLHAIPEITARSPDTKIVVLSGIPLMTEPLISRGAHAHLEKALGLQQVAPTLLNVCECG